MHQAETVTFTSSVIPVVDLADNRGISFSFTDVSPPAGTVGSGVFEDARAPFAADISGDFSATVPEPGDLGDVGPRFAGSGLARADPTPAGSPLRALSNSGLV